MAKFIAIELVDASGAARGIRQLNLDCITRADIINPTGTKGESEIEVWLSDGFSFQASGMLAEQIILALAKYGENPVK